MSVNVVFYSKTLDIGVHVHTSRKAQFNHTCMAVMHNIIFVG